MVTTEDVQAIIAAGRMHGYIDFAEAAEDYKRMPTVVDAEWVFTMPEPLDPPLLVWGEDHGPKLRKVHTNLWVSTAVASYEPGPWGPVEKHDWHLPVLDVDIPRSLLVNNDIQTASPDKVLLYHPEAITWVPSSTRGHHHVYIDWPMHWVDFEEMMYNLQQKGVLERGYVLASMERGFSCVRKPGVMKPPPPPVVVDDGDPF